ncbi:MAG TPA: PilZ domain-containing protein [Blastocatellia bacterium]|jgi:uncharacterized protein (TIGR02266 family)|nr:PilZ domain-containing protein [Blastocatellia bacterium]
MDDERRQAKRAPLLIEVRYEGGGRRGQSRISDISATGVYIDTMNPLPDGSQAKLDFTLPGGYRVEAEGVVVRSEPSIGMAIRFKQINPQDQQRIADLVT